MNPIVSRKLKKVLWTGVIWYIAFVLFHLIEKGVMGDLDKYPSTGNLFNFQSLIIFGPLFALFAGLALGFTEVFWLNRKFRSSSFGRKILLKSLIYLSLIILCMATGTIISNSISLNESLFSKSVINSVVSFMTDFAFISLMVYISFIVLIVLFVLEVSDNLGVSTLQNFLLGKYHHPVKESRFFMFLDLKSSTTIAEELGHVKYFEFLRDYYDDITNPIIHSKGIIYQYVGDEIVISWTEQEGAEQNNVLHTYYRIKELISDRSEFYQEKYGTVPVFKAGLHFGGITTGEIGKIKKEIIHTGDTLNTASRIQGLCNTYNVETLISQDAMERLENSDSEFRFRHIGEVSLRGRDQMIQLYTFEPGG